jgi:hypothetical protein
MRYPGTGDAETYPTGMWNGSLLMMRGLTDHLGPNAETQGQDGRTITLRLLISVWQKGIGVLLDESRPRESPPYPSCLYAMAARRGFLR